MALTLHPGITRSGEIVWYPLQIRRRPNGGMRPGAEQSSQYHLLGK